jgi:hypothetical protein
VSLRLAAPILEDFGHLARNMRPDEIDQFLALSGLSEYVPDVAARAFALTGGLVWAVVNDANRAVLVGGFQPVRPGVFDAWLVGTMENWAAHGRAFTRICRRQIQALLADGAHRVQIAALASRTGAHEWYQRGLGMQREGVLRGYCADGQDAIMFARIKP